MSKHTPTPWTYVAIGDSDGEYSSVDHFVKIGDGEMHVENEADARFIVTAVNAHDMLTTLARKGHILTFMCDEKGGFLVDALDIFEQQEHTGEGASLSDALAEVYHKATAKAVA